MSPVKTKARKNSAHESKDSQALFDNHRIPPELFKETIGEASFALACLLYTDS